jgi:hypothetical protein
MKMIVITENGKIRGFAHGSKADHTGPYATKKNGGPHAGLRTLPGQEMREVEVPDELAKIEDGQELHDRLNTLINW